MNRFKTLFVFLLLADLLAAQPPVNKALEFNVIPPPPEAASLGKYIDMPTNPYTGIPKIEIPVYQLRSHELSLPISLSYHASGIKWEEISSWIGAGWALNAGFTISRSIRGRNDEEPFRGFLAPTTMAPYSISSFFNADGSYNVTNLSYVKNTGSCVLSPVGEDIYRNVLYASKGGLDLEPDLFFFSLPDGQSGKFVFSRSGQIKVIPNQHLDITYTNGFSSWKIIGKDGTQYFFDKAEITQNASSCGEVMNGPETFTIPPVIAPNSWKLTKIKSANNLDSIWFEYDAENLQYQTTSSVTHYDRVIGNVAVPGSSECLNNTHVSGWRLKRIRTKAGYYVEFVANTSRPDLTGGKYLDQILVFHKTTFIKRFLLNRGGAIPTLTSLQESFEQSATTITTPAYEFSYYTEGVDLPTYSRTSPNVDHWGFYNAASNSVGKRVPATIFQNIYYTGANRESVFEACRFMTLKEIKYPTGGTTTYEYELNDFNNIPAFQSFTYSPGLELVESIEFSVTNPTTPLPTAYQNKSFSLSGQTNLVILYEVPGVEGGGIPASGLHATLTKSGDATFVPIQFISGNAQDDASPIYSFSPGSYTLSGQYAAGAYTLLGSQFYVRIYRVVSLDERVQNNSLKGGGLRVKKIITKGDQTLVKSFSYTHRSTNQTSGKLMSFPIYTRLTGVADATPNGNACLVNSIGTMLVRSNASTLPLTMTQGAHVGYSEVLEYHGDGTSNNGYSIYHYTNTPDVGNVMIPFVQGYSSSYKNGFLIKKEDYTSGQKKVKEMVNDYAYYPDNKIVVGIKVSQDYSSGCSGCQNRIFVGNTYVEPSERVELVKTIERVYDVATDGFFETENRFVYNSFDQVVEKQQKVSNGGSKRLYTNYDYHPLVKTMPIREYSYYYDPLNSSKGFELVGGVKKNLSPLILKPTEILLTEHAATPQPFSNLTAFVENSFVSRMIFSSFDNHGNVLSYKLTNSPTSTQLIWDPDGRVPIAKIEHSRGGRVAFTSFENGSNEGGWQFSSWLDFTNKKTGIASQRLTNPITCSSLVPTERYVLSFWAWNGIPVISAGEPDAISATADRWTYYEKIISNVSEITISGTSRMRIDELRLYPEGARMVSYTHDPRTGITSVADENFQIRNFSYNSRLQLEFERDFDSNILKRFEYRFSRDN